MVVCLNVVEEVLACPLHAHLLLVMQGRHGAPAIYSPHKSRHIFVTYRREKGEVPGPSELGASAVMGHHARMWDQVYDLQARTGPMQEVRCLFVSPTDDVALALAH